MPKLPRVKPKKVIKILEKAGFFVDHISGSHYIFYKNDNTLPVSVPFHNKNMKIGTLICILKQAKLSRQKFIDLL